MRNYRQAQAKLIHAIEKEEVVPCQELPDVFFPEDWPDAQMRKRATQVAKNLCDSCPIKFQCLQAALENQEGYGIWGGLTPKERGNVGR